MPRNERNSFIGGGVPAKPGSESNLVFDPRNVVVEVSGPPNHLSVDQAREFISAAEINLEATGVNLREFSIDYQGIISAVESYHAPLRSAYENIRMELGQELSYDDFSHM